MNKKYIYFFLAAFIFVVDRVSKMAALAYCTESARTINSYLSFEVVFNRGISWGMLNSTSDIVFVLVSLMIAVITAFLCWHAYYQYMRGNAILGEVCIIAGSVSNLIDRVVYGGVIDFIVLSYNTFSWPVFNVADAAIVCGVGILIFCYEK